MARQIRAGLEDKPALTVIQGKKDKLAESFFGKPVRAHVKDFGALFGTIFLVVAAYRRWHGHSLLDTALFSSIGILFAYLGYQMPKVLRPVWKAWMTMAHYMGTVMTFVIMAATWGLAFVPMALVLRAAGKGSIKREFNKNATTTYWVTRKAAADDFKRLERQY